MATEFYIIKPDKKEMYCLGKRLKYFSHIPEECYGKEPDYHEYECFHDFVVDVVDCNSEFIEICWGDTICTFYTLLTEIFEFICDGKILLISDVSDNFSKYSDYKEVGSVVAFFENLHKDEEKVEEIDTPDKKPVNIHITEVLLFIITTIALFIILGGGKL